MNEEFQLFAATRWPRLFRTAFLLCGEPHSAEDLVQQTLERAYLAWSRVSRADEPDAYVRRIMLNEHARHHRRRSRESLFGQVLETHQPTMRPDAADERTALLAALATLPPRQRQAVVLRYWEDLSVTQAAAAMSCAVGTVKSHSAKGLARLREHPGLANLGVPTGGER